MQSAYDVLYGTEETDRLRQHGLRTEDLFEEEDARWAEEDVMDEGNCEEGCGDEIDDESWLSHIHNAFWNYFPFSHQRFHHLTTSSENVNNTFIRFVKTMEEFVFGLEVFLRCVENVTLLCREGRLRN